MANAKRDDNYIPVLLGTSSSDGSTPVLVYANASTNRMLVDALTSFSGNGTIADGSKNVTTAGTAVALGAATTIKRIIVQARHTNTDAIVIGGSTVVAAAGTRRGVALLTGQSVTLTSDDLAEIFIDSIVSGEGVTFLYEV